MQVQLIYELSLRSWFSFSEIQELVILIKHLRFSAKMQKF